MSGVSINDLRAAALSLFFALPDTIEAGPAKVGCLNLRILLGATEAIGPHGCHPGTLGHSVELIEKYGQFIERVNLQKRCVEEFLRKLKNSDFITEEGGTDDERMEKMVKDFDAAVGQLVTEYPTLRAALRREVLRLQSEIDKAQKVEMPAEEFVTKSADFSEKIVTLSKEYHQVRALRYLFQARTCQQIWYAYNGYVALVPKVEQAFYSDLPEDATRLIERRKLFKCLEESMISQLGTLPEPQYVTTEEPEDAEVKRVAEAEVKTRMTHLQETLAPKWNFCCYGSVYTQWMLDHFAKQKTLKLATLPAVSEQFLRDFETVIIQGQHCNLTDLEKRLVERYDLLEQGANYLLAIQPFDIALLPLVKNQLTPELSQQIVNPAKRVEQAKPLSDSLVKAWESFFEAQLIFKILQLKEMQKRIRGWQDEIVRFQAGLLAFNQAFSQYDEHSDLKQLTQVSPESVEQEWKKLNGMYGEFDAFILKEGVSALIFLQHFKTPSHPIPELNLSNLLEKKQGSVFQAKRDLATSFKQSLLIFWKCAEHYSAYTEIFCYLLPTLRLRRLQNQACLQQGLHPGYQQAYLEWQASPKIPCVAPYQNWETKLNQLSDGDATEQECHALLDNGREVSRVWYELRKKYQTYSTVIRTINHQEPKTQVVVIADP